VEFSYVPDPPAGADSKVTLTTGEELKGKFVSSDEKSVTIEHPLLGTMNFTREQVKSVEDLTPAPDPDSFFKGWDFTIEAGVVGASGNTERFGARAAFGGVRDTTQTVTLIGASYLYAVDDGDKSQDRFEAFIRNDWKLPENKWRIYAKASAEYDYFKDYDWRVTGVVGVGYELIDNETTLLLPRVGIALTKEFGGSDNRIIPELNLGFDFAHKFSDTAKFFFTFDSYWSMLDYPEYRLVGATGLEFLLDAESGMIFKIGAEDRYDSTPGEGNSRNDLTYFATVGWKF
jgi:putative salt-induced outer membrane protein YdiY